MAPVTHQTIKLGRGKHASPDEGACVMELASMLAGEPFSDHPVSVCPVIGSFLRADNDSIDDDRRQDLYPYAAEAVGSRASARVQEERAERLTAWAAAQRPRRRLRLFSRPCWAALGAGTTPERVGILAVQAIPKRDPTIHARVLGLIDELLAMSRTAGARHTPPTASSGRPRAYV
jgi:hypothetical protein